MASVLLQTAGTTLGGVVGGPAGAVLGAQLGKAAGGFLDNQIIGPTKLKDREGPRLSDLAVQTSTYGAVIPILYGSMRLAGNIIWSQPIRETVITSTASSGGGKAGGGRVEQTTRTYSYSITLAIAVCEGPIDEVVRVWADSKPLNLDQGTYRVYKGTEDQQPDTLIESIEGIGNTPAYRGLAYVVIEDFPLEDYGNRIPNFTFEVKKKAWQPESSGLSTEEMIKSVIMIPGSGEFVYDTQKQVKISGETAGSEFAQIGHQTSLNVHNNRDKANALVSLDQLARDLPNVEWVGVVVNWFGDSLAAGSCTFLPGVEFQTGAITSPETWSVGSFTRATAHQITLENGTPRYGGTPDDQSLLRYLDELQNRGYKVLFYPMPLMDVTDKPWRGRITGAAGNVSGFFTGTNGYNAFITHYANLVKDKVDAFVIGSELVGLTKITDTPGNYPAVNQLVSLAATVKGIVGAGVKVTYAADWSEYHHTDGGWYHLDPLWASANIDVVGIDAYFPLTEDLPQPSITLQDVIDGWTEGEGYDYYWTDVERTNQQSLSQEYAWKNLQWWWENQHTNPDMSTTAWVAESKPIWFTEYGFPSVDGATNQPNVFYDPESTESAFPRGSRGRVDNHAQRLGITATELKWLNSSMIERRFLWTWDARPFPFFPDLNEVWADGANWRYGHWVQGKLGVSSLAAIVKDLCLRAGLESAQIDVSRLEGLVEGFSISQRQSVRDSLEQLMQGYFFEAVESDGTLKFVPRQGTVARTLTEDELAPLEYDGSRTVLQTVRQQEIELPRTLNVLYVNKSRDYQPGHQAAQRQTTITQQAITSSLPIVFADAQAKTVADITLYNSWLSRTQYECMLPLGEIALEPTDVIQVTTASGVTHTLRITQTDFGQPGVVRVYGVAEDISVFDAGTPAGEAPAVTDEALPVGETRLEFLDLPAFPGDAPDRARLRFAAAGVDAGWKGAVLYRSDDQGGSYHAFTTLQTACVVGMALDTLATGPSAVFDEVGEVTVALTGNGELASTTPEAVLNGANVALSGDEIFQFKNAELIAPGKYKLSGLLRGRLGTEYAIGSHQAGERFVLLNAAIVSEEMPDSLIGLARLYKPVSVGGSLTATSAQSFTYTARALKPYAPVQVEGARNGGGDLTISWVRRTRLGGEWRDNVDAPLNETSERYEVDILDGGNVVRTLTGLTSPQAVYSAADQTTDFGAPQSSVEIEVFQLSEQVGRGTGASAAV